MPTLPLLVLKMPATPKDAVAEVDIVKPGSQRLDLLTQGPVRLRFQPRRHAPLRSI